MSDINELLKDEYLIYTHASSKLQNIKIISDPKKKRKIYDILQELLELRTFYRYEKKTPPYHGYHKIEKDEYNLINKFFDTWNEYIQKVPGTNINADYNNIKRIKNYYLNTLANFHNNYDNYYKKLNNDEIIVTDNYIMYYDLQIDRDERINKLLKKSDSKNVLYMLMRYINYGITGMHCSLPYDVYKFLYDEFKIRAEGFSSPLNSKLIFMKDTIICTLFKDTDEPFGSTGPFSLDTMLAHPEKNWAINPPYMATVMEVAYNNIVEAFNQNKRHDLLILYLIPRWTDDETYIRAANNKDILVKLIELPEEHYMDCNGNVVKMNSVTNSMFIFSRNKNIIKEEQYDKLIKLWTTKSKSFDQSTLEKPKKIFHYNI